MQESFRDNGAIGAFLDEYERAIHELKQLIGQIKPEDLTKIVNNKQVNFASIQNVLNHVIRAGHHYVFEIRKWLGEEVSATTDKNFATIEDYKNGLDDIFLSAEKLFHDYPEIKLNENNPDKKIKVGWGQLYDVEQLLEHALVHILSHRRQIERYLLILKS